MGVLFKRISNRKIQLCDRVVLYNTHYTILKPNKCHNEIGNELGNFKHFEPYSINKISVNISEADSAILLASLTPHWPPSSVSVEWESPVCHCWRELKFATFVSFLHFRTPTLMSTSMKLFLRVCNIPKLNTFASK